MKLSMKPPDKVIGPASNPYMLRWFILKGPDSWPRAYLHKFMRSDDDRALHDHPWWFFSVVLWSGYWEVTENGRRWRGRWSVAFRRATDTHRVELEPGKPRPITLFIAGPVKRVWGFWCWEQLNAWTARTMQEFDFMTRLHNAGRDPTSIARFIPFEEFDGCPGDG